MRAVEKSRGERRRGTEQEQETRRGKENWKRGRIKRRNCFGLCSPVAAEPNVLFSFSLKISRE